ncbi:MAG TPA: histidine phosphotransferase family protein, partial [Paracoccus sp. (in: a-proteobacteria)]|nr:histidine phosphotransferase family protein [Paracoccus sp. (in: a-proteobacteria)]
MNCAATPVLACEPDQAGSELPLAALVGSRLCHDLISPLGAIGNGVELLQMSGDWPGIAKSPELQLIVESVQSACARIRVFRLAFGHAAPDQRLAVSELRGLAQAYAAGSRMAIDLPADGDLPRNEARMILLGMMCLDSALPWGGRVLICRSEPGWRLVAEAARTRPNPALWAWLNGPRAGQATPAPAAVPHCIDPVKTCSGV